MQLRRLAALERQKNRGRTFNDSRNNCLSFGSFGSPGKILKVIKDEIIKLKEKFGDARRTKVFKSKVGEFTDEQLIPNEETIITMTETGYIKRVPRSSFKLQERGGKGVIGMTTKDEDAIGKLVSAHTHDNLLFFSDRGKVYQVRVWDIPEGSRQSKGQAVVNLINTESTEKSPLFLPTA